MYFLTSPLLAYHPTTTTLLHLPSNGAFARYAQNTSTHAVFARQRMKNKSEQELQKSRDDTRGNNCALPKPSENRKRTNRHTSPNAKCARGMKYESRAFPHVCQPASVVSRTAQQNGNHGARKQRKGKSIQRLKRPSCNYLYLLCC